MCPMVMVIWYIVEHAYFQLDVIKMNNMQNNMKNEKALADIIYTEFFSLLSTNMAFRQTSWYLFLYIFLDQHPMLLLDDVEIQCHQLRDLFCH